MFGNSLLVSAVLVLVALVLGACVQTDAAFDTVARQVDERYCVASEASRLALREQMVAAFARRGSETTLRIECALPPVRRE